MKFKKISEKIIKSLKKQFDIKFRFYKRKYKKQQSCNLLDSAIHSKPDMWATLKKLDNPPSSRAALEIIRADATISRDIREILERWHGDISKLFAGV